MEDIRYYRRSLGHRANVREAIQANYESAVVDLLRAYGNQYDYGWTKVRIAREFGFCQGVARALELAYETCHRFPDRKIWITGEIIHNPGVNRHLEEMGVRFLSVRNEGSDRLAPVGPEDVLIIPAFGIDHADLERLRKRGSILVDTTCGNVLRVWKTVERYARAGITAVVHGKVNHEETRATCSQVRRYPGSHYLVVRDRDEAECVCRFLEGRLDGEKLKHRLSGAYSERFDPEMHLQRIGVANQTTMLSSESLEIADMLRTSLAGRYGEENLPEHFHSFDTICSATQSRQDAVQSLLREGCDLIIVVGGFNSNNTTHLVKISASAIPTFHIQKPDDLISPSRIRHLPVNSREPIEEKDWLRGGPLTVGVTAGASTPDKEIGQAIARILTFRGVPETVVEGLMDEGNRLAAEGAAIGMTTSR